MLYPVILSSIQICCSECEIMVITPFTYSIQIRRNEEEGKKSGSLCEIFAFHRELTKKKKFARLCGVVFGLMKTLPAEKLTSESRIRKNSKRMRNYFWYNMRRKMKLIKRLSEVMWKVSFQFLATSVELSASVKLVANYIIGHSPARGTSKNFLSKIQKS